ncbi:hypothetical protein BO71DRAFT_479134 [Aspergillus ellipticus CBS 707.79]|uniref:Major facilitator superfamily (MFS) profile domain-containing protein n=1 Tax=Aspergillus ellipticus CBS 707.79 TaxID=1448320 RepID=A0A319DQQ4_9EURO|nr:hypothetical protein BO71DRAFT_479134 [Aspergillus ellipticus CBS 707.79]
MKTVRATYAFSYDIYQGNSPEVQRCYGRLCGKLNVFHDTTVWVQRPIAGAISDRKSRRDSTVLVLVCLQRRMGTAFETGVSGFRTLIAGCIFISIFLGIISSHVPVNRAEISKKCKRAPSVCSNNWLSNSVHHVPFCRT